MSTITMTTLRPAVSSLSVQNRRALRALLRPALSRPGLRLTWPRPSARLDVTELERLLEACESGRYRIHPVNLYWVRSRLAALLEVEARNRLMREARTADENRYAEEDETVWPAYPTSRSTRSKRMICLTDGRRALLLDARRALPLCGVRTPVAVSDDIVRGVLVSMKYGAVCCPRCLGYHHTTSVTSPIPVTPSPVAPSLRCGHCQAPPPHLTLRSEGGVVVAHCLCGWERVLTTGLTEETVRQNEAVLSLAPIRTRSEDGSTESDPAAETLLFGEAGEDEDAFDVSALRDAEHEEPEGESDEFAEETDEDLEQALLHRLLRLWEQPGLRALRCALLERTFTGQLTPQGCEAVSVDRLNLIWVLAATQTETLTHLCEQDVADLVQWLVRASDEDLVAALDEPYQYVPLPRVSAKIRSWALACRRSLRRWHFPRTGVRHLAPKFGVSEAAFATVCADLMTARRR